VLEKEIIPFRQNGLFIPLLQISTGHLLGMRGFYVNDNFFPCSPVFFLFFFFLMAASQAGVCEKANTVVCLAGLFFRAEFRRP